MEIRSKIMGTSALGATLVAALAVGVPADAVPARPVSGSAVSGSAVSGSAVSGSAVSGSASTSAVSGSAVATACATAWGTGAKRTGFRMTGAELYNVRAGRHTCFDRLVFDVNGPAPVDATVRYVRVVLSDPAGRPVPVAGRADLQVVVRAPWLSAGSSGHQPYRKVPAIGARLVPLRTLGGLAVVRDVRFAGTFEGISTVAVGVDARRPFRLFVTRDGLIRHVVVDVARR